MRFEEYRSTYRSKAGHDVNVVALRRAVHGAVILEHIGALKGSVTIGANEKEPCEYRCVIRHHTPAGSTASD